MTASLEEFLHSLTVASVITTLVDVLLVYYLIYRLLLTIRGTRAAQMVVGIVLVGAAFFVAERVRLRTARSGARWPRCRGCSTTSSPTSSSSSSSYSRPTSAARSAGSARA